MPALMDIVDEATVIIEAERDEGVRRARAGLGGEGAADCEDCPRTIPVARRRAMPSARRCVECQALADRRQRFNGGM